MKLNEFVKNPKLIQPRKSKVHKVERKKRKSSGNSADDVLINESDRMTQYVSEENKQKIINVRTAYHYGVKKIGSRGDHAGILKKNLMPETSERARRIASQNFFRKYHSDTIKFYTKNHYARKISYLRNGKTISYFMGLDVRTGKRISIPSRIKNKLIKGFM